MKSSKGLSYAKKVFHALTAAAAAFAAIPNGVFTGKAAIWLALASSIISGALHVLTSLWPDVAAEEAKVPAE